MKILLLPKGTFDIFYLCIIYILSLDDRLNIIFNIFLFFVIREKKWNFFRHIFTGYSDEYLEHHDFNFLFKISISISAFPFPRTIQEELVTLRTLPWQHLGRLLHLKFLLKIIPLVRLLKK